MDWSKMLVTGGIFAAVWVEQKLGGGNLVDQLPHC